MTKYCKEIKEKICNYMREGDSQKLACNKVGIGTSAFHDWVRKDPQFSEDIKKAKDDFQATILGKLEASLWKRALGYEATETEVEYVGDAQGNPTVIKSRKTKVKHFAPDVGALVFALTNVAPDKWVNRQRVDNTILTKDKEEEQTYHFEDLPDDLLFSLADKLQDAEKKRAEEKKQ